MTSGDISMYIEALSSCAIEGNAFAIEMLELRDKDPEAFMVRLGEWASKGRTETFKDGINRTE